MKELLLRLASGLRSGRLEQGPQEVEECRSLNKTARVVLGLAVLSLTYELSSSIRATNIQHPIVSENMPSCSRPCVGVMQFMLHCTVHVRGEIVSSHEAPLRRAIRKHSDNISHQ